MNVKTRETLYFEVEHRPGHYLPFMAICPEREITVYGCTFEDLMTNAEITVLKLLADTNQNDLCNPQLIFNTFMRVPAMHSLPDQV